MKGVQHTHCIFARLMYQWTWNTCAVLLWGLTLASNCVHGSVRPQHRIRARRQQIRLERIRRGWSKTMDRKNNCPRIEQSRRTENNNVRDLQQFLDSRFANETISDLRSQWHMPLAFCEFRWRTGLILLYLKMVRASCRRKEHWIPSKTCNSGRLHNHYLNAEFESRTILRGTVEDNEENEIE